MTVDVRCAEVDDAEALLAFRRRLFGETNFMLFEPAEFKSTPDDERKFIERFAQRDNYRLLVACEAAEVVGFLAAMGGERNRNRHSVLVALGVAKSHWSRGIAGRLLDDVIAWSATVGIRRLELTVHVTNVRAVGLYLRKGFEVEGRRRSSLCVDGQFVDEYLMSLILDA